MGFWEPSLGQTVASEQLDIFCLIFLLLGCWFSKNAPILGKPIT